MQTFMESFTDQELEDFAKAMNEPVVRDYYKELELLTKISSGITQHILDVSQAIKKAEQIIKETEQSNPEGKAF